jgi:glucosamine--fructose-6-phosphate aminotransferase (isomerizing)
MCGIVGYAGNRDAARVLYEGLKKLEYRGYDSAGIATVVPGKIEVRKDVGRIEAIDKKLHFDSMPGKAGIAHTRWATHGGVTRENAHPHTSCDGAVAVVHNGILENFTELKAQLESEGHRFTSQTDSEVIPHLVERYMKAGLGFQDAVFKATQQLTGSYAALVASAKEPDIIIAFRKESPLVIGMGKGEYIAASDVLPILEHTRSVVYLEDGEAAVMSKDGVKFYSLESGKEMTKETHMITWDYSEAQRGGYPHFMLKEIKEQPEVIKRTLMQDKEKLNKVAQMINSYPRVAIVACGTSRHAALVGRYAISELGGKYCEVYMASEFQYFVEKVGKETLIIAVSQSGETADVLVPVRMAKKAGCKVISIVNVVGSSLDRESDISLYLNCGPEISVASTKAFTCQCALFYQLAFLMAFEYEQGMAQLSDLPDKIAETIRINEERIKKLAEKLKGKNDIYYIARAINFAVATEGALKIKEISYIHAEGMPAGELKHGTLALIEKGTPVIAIAPHDNTYQETVANIAEAKARGAFVIGITDHPNGIFDEVLEIPTVNPILYPLLANIPGQMLAYYLAVARGTDVDKPRNLAKSVTVR